MVGIFTRGFLDSLIKAIGLPRNQKIGGIKQKIIHAFSLSSLMMVLRSWLKLIQKLRNQNEVVNHNTLRPKLSLIFPPEIKVAMKGNIWVIHQA